MFKSGLMVFVFAFVLHGGAFARVMMMPQVEQPQADLAAPSVQGAPQQTLILAPSDEPDDGVSEKMPMAEPPAVGLPPAPSGMGDPLVRTIVFFACIIVLLVVAMRVREKVRGNKS